MKSFVDKLEAINAYNGIITRFILYFYNQMEAIIKKIGITCPGLVGICYWNSLMCKLEQRLKRNEIQVKRKN